MKALFLKAICVFAVLHALMGVTAVQASAPAVVENITHEAWQALLPELQKGGYVFFFRHAATRLDQEDSQPVVRGDCHSQRNLSDEGRRFATLVGQVFRRDQIPVGRVLSSPFCRCLDTARLAFAIPEVSDDLFFAIGLGRSERQAKGAALRRLLMERPKAGSNVVIVAHTANLEEAMGLWPKPEGAGYLFRPDGQGGVAVLGRLAPELWPAVLPER